MAERLKLCYVEGKKKKGKKSALVPILFPDECVAAIRLLIKHRAVAEIVNDNSYIFASGELFYRGWDTLQSLTKKIKGLKKPQLITPTRTRKLVATMLQLLDMTEAELTWLTNHMGHTKDVHFAWYRKEDSSIELTKVAKVLTAVDRGKNIQNKRIDHVLDDDAGDCDDRVDGIDDDESDDDAKGGEEDLEQEHAADREEGAQDNLDENMDRRRRKKGRDLFKAVYSLERPHIAL